MFSCCFQPSSGSGPRRATNRGLGHLWRRWVRPLAQCWPFSRRNPPVTLNAADFTVHQLWKVRSNIPGYLEKLVSYLAKAVQTEDFMFVCGFLGVYQRFGNAWQVLDLIMKTYASFQPDSEEDQETKKAICYFLGLWIEHFPGDFCDSPNLARLNQLMNYVQDNMPSSALAIQVQELLSRLEDQETNKAAPKKEKACDSESSRVPEGPEQYASGMSEILDPRSASAAEPQGELALREDSVEPEVMETCVTAVQPTEILTVTCVEQDLLTEINTQPAPDEDVNVPAPESCFNLSISQIGDPEPILPLPKVD